MDGTDGDLGLFGPGSVTWTVHREPIVALGGLRALYLQTLHPRALAGVLQNSGYRSDPWGRLGRTATYVATTVYGTTAQAERAGRRVRAVHARLTATDPATGEEFRVDEPDLLRWVHVTEVESFLDCARRAGVRLSATEADRYLDEQRRVAALVGLEPETVPGSVAEVRDYYRDMRPRLAMTREAAEVALFLSTPPLPWQLTVTPVRGALFGVAALAVGMLPSWARRMYGLPGLAVTGTLVSLQVRTLRGALRAVPRRAYEGPMYRDAMRRAALAATDAPGGEGA